MGDFMTDEQRSWNMSRIRSKDTKPELLVRSLIHSLGYRFRLHDRKLPGRPDIVFPKLKKVVFVHGCFWHRHEGCPCAPLPKSNRDFWTAKLNTNRNRDIRNQLQLRERGWSYLIIWECETRKPDLSDRILSFLKDGDPAPDQSGGRRMVESGRGRTGIDAHQSIPVIDIFAGPGGLGEGFASFCQGKCGFDLRLSIEKDPYAHETLELRTFLREIQQLSGGIPGDYYDFLRQDLTRAELFERYPAQAKTAAAKAWKAELGSDDFPPALVDSRIKQALSGSRHFVLIGGPPCQAYSIVGRSRRRGIKEYKPEEDVRQRLYIEYLQILADHQPVVFVMENVKGLLSATLNQEAVFDRILLDLRSPAEAIVREGRSVANAGILRGYRLFSLVEPGECLAGERKSFLVEAEKYGIPQARHRVIILGLRDDFRNVSPKCLRKGVRRTLGHALHGLPRLRSGLSCPDSSDSAWRDVLFEVKNALGDARKLNKVQALVQRSILEKLSSLHMPQSGCGGIFVEYTGAKKRRNHTWAEEQLADERIGGVCNHETRNHIPGDLHRYLYAACFAAIMGKSPTLRDFPFALLPMHKNVQSILAQDESVWRKAAADLKFADRFRVQTFNRPCTTITSHIAKDGHYYIHPDPTQCRSLTVREAARIQTFPDNYFFCGSRTAQYQQVGNAVPPILAGQIAAVVHDIFRQAGLIASGRRSH